MRRLTVTVMVLGLLATPTATFAAEEHIDTLDGPVYGRFSSTGALAEARSGHDAALLTDGRVLIDGGAGAAEVWDPTTGAFAPADSIAALSTEPGPRVAVGRIDHSTTLLPDGRVLVSGGRGSGDEVLDSALIWDPRKRTLTAAGSLAEPRSGHSATFLRDGRVLVVGGTNADGDLASAELWRSVARPANCFGKRPTLFALPGVEFVGTSGADVIAGSVGADTISGLGGNDRICAGAGADMVDGGAGNDRLSGGMGGDQLDGGIGKDVCNGGKGIDWLPGCNDRFGTRGTLTINRNTKLKGPRVGRIKIGRDGVTLDCDGHTITGLGRRSYPWGIELNGRKGVTVRNCDLRDFILSGVLLQQSDRNTLRSNRVSNVGFSGFQIEDDSNRNRLIGNTITDVRENAGIAILQFSDRNKIRKNVATEANEGFFIWYSDRNVFADNIARDNRGPGFSVEASSYRAVNNRFNGNSAHDNGWVGFADDTDGSRGDAGTDNHYMDNICSGNDGGGSQPASLCDNSGP